MFRGPSWAIGVLLITGCLLLQERPIAASENVVNENVVNGRSTGRDIFLGAVPLRATILGQSSRLPPETAACGNCHATNSQPEADGSFAPRLDRSTMMESRRRRNGPPSHFSPTTFCRLLRTGVDPAYIVISRQMPRYQLNDNACLDLWRYLTEPGNGSREDTQ
jgi:hypothetical protein